MNARWFLSNPLHFKPQTISNSKRLIDGRLTAVLRLGDGDRSQILIFLQLATRFLLRVLNVALPRHYLLFPSSFAGSLTEPERGSDLLFGWISPLELTLTFAVKLKWNASRLTGDTRYTSLSCAASLLPLVISISIFFSFSVRKPGLTRAQMLLAHTAHNSQFSRTTTFKKEEWKGKNGNCDESEGNFHIHNPKKERSSAWMLFNSCLCDFSSSSCSPPHYANISCSCPCHVFIVDMGVKIHFESHGEHTSWTRIKDFDSWGDERQRNK